MTGESRVDVAIIGAGPYGLSIASMLSEAGVDHRIFGEAMRTWRHMPVGMCLKSFGFGTSIPSPRDGYELPEFCRRVGVEDFEPIPTSAFVDYGEWFQRELVPHLEPHLVARVRENEGAFEVALQTGETFRARKVVVATGLTNLAYVPPELAAAEDRISHTSTNRQYLEFAGREVIVVGRGQSALEAAALLHEAGAKVQVLTRRRLDWSVPLDRNQPLWKRVVRPNTSIGASRVSWLMVKWPVLLHHGPDAIRLYLLRTYLGPAGAWWLRERVEGRVPIHEDTRHISAVRRGDGVSVTVTSSGGTRKIDADHIVAGTGYRVDLARLDFLEADTARRVRRIGGAPAVSRYCESSVPGLYFVGPTTAPSFGPLMRFVAGASYAVPLVTRHLRATLSALGASVVVAPHSRPTT